MTDPKVKPVARFYEFPSLPEDGRSFDEVYLNEDNFEPNVLVGGGDNIPFIVEVLNERLKQMFEGREHIVQIEKIGEDFFYVHRWRGTYSNKRVVRLARFDANELPKDKGKFLAIKIPAEGEVFVKDGEVVLRRLAAPYYRAYENVYLRYLLVPLNIHLGPDKETLNKDSLVALDAQNNILNWSNKKWPAEFNYVINDVTNIGEGSYEPGLYVVDLIPVGAFQKPEEKPIVVEKRIVVERPVTVERPIPPPAPSVKDDKNHEKFPKKIVKKAGDIKGKDIEIFFVVDHSGSMEPAVELLIKSVGQVVKDLKKKGAKDVKIGLVTFCDKGRIDVAMGLTEMNEASIVRLFTELGKIEFTGGKEPVGEAALQALQLMKKDENASQQIWVLTDGDGLSDDESYPDTLTGAIAKGREAGIDVELQLVELQWNEGGRRVSIADIAAVEVLKTTDRSDKLYELIKKPSTGYSVRYNWDQHLLAAAALADIGDPNGMRGLVEVVLNAPDIGMRAEAVRSLKLYGNKAREALHDLADAVQEEKLLAGIAGILIDMGDKKGKEMLAKILSKGRSNIDPSAKVGSARVLYKLGKKEDGLRIMLDVANDENAILEDRLNAMEFLVEHGKGGEIKEMLVDLVVNAGSFNIQRDAFKLLLRLGDEGNVVLPSVMERLNGQEYLLLNIASDLSASGVDVTSVFKELALNGKEIETRYKASVILLKLNEAEGINALIAVALKGPGQDLFECQKKAVNELIGLGERGRDALVRITKEAKFDHQWVALIAGLSLLRSGDEMGIESIQNLAETASDWKLRSAALDALVDAGNKGREILKQLMKNEKNSLAIRLKAAQVLGRSGGEEGLLALREIADTGWTEKARFEALTALIEMGELAYEPLKYLVKDCGDENIQLGAAAVLIKAGLECGRDALVKLSRKARDKNVRFLAAKELIGGGYKKDGMAALIDLVLHAKVGSSQEAVIKFLISMGADAARSLGQIAISPEGKRFSYEIILALSEAGERGKKALLELAVDINENGLFLDIARKFAKGGTYLPLAYYFVIQEDTKKYLKRDVETVEDHISVASDIFDEAKELDAKDADRITRLVIAIVSCLELDSPEETYDMAENLMKWSKNSDDTMFMLTSLAKLIPASATPESLKDYVALVEEAGGYDAGKRDEVIELVAEYASEGRAYSEVVEYARDLLNTLKNGGGAIKEKIMGVEYRMATRLGTNQDGVHYYVNLGREKGVGQLRALTLRAATEESWLYIEYEVGGVKFIRWFENGKMEGAETAVSDNVVLSALLKNKDVKIGTVTAYHIHPVGNNNLNDSLVSLLSSPEDVAAAVMLGLNIRAMGYNGPIDCRAVTPYGEYTLSPVDATMAIGDGEPLMTEQSQTEQVAPSDFAPSSVVLAMEVEAKKAADNYKKWLDDNRAGRMFEADVVEGLTENGLINAKYLYHNGHMENIHAIYREIIKIGQSLRGRFSSNGGKGDEEAALLFNELRTLSSNFSKEIASAEETGVPQELLSFFKLEAKDTEEMVASLARLF